MSSQKLTSGPYPQRDIPKCMPSRSRDVLREKVYYIDKMVQVVESKHN